MSWAIGALFAVGSVCFALGSVPAYNLPPDAEEVHLMRVVVRIDLSRRMIDLLLLDILQAWDELTAEQPADRTLAKADLWTSPAHAAGHAKHRANRGK